MKCAFPEQFQLFRSVLLPQLHVFILNSNFLVSFFLGYLLHPYFLQFLALSPYILVRLFLYHILFLVVLLSSLSLHRPSIPSPPLGRSFFHVFLHAMT
jgi:hypothetical protein